MTDAGKPLRVMLVDDHAVVRAGYRVPKYPETQAYVRRIMAGLKAPDASPM